MTGQTDLPVSNDPVDWEYICKAERSHIRESKSDSEAELPLSGIALTGGGIRSGTFALGVLQALAQKNLLGAFDYLSSVSGGGYAACSVRWLLHAGADRYGLGEDDFPYSEEAKFGTQTEPGDGRDLLEHLRNHGDYLTPGEMTAASGVSVVLRAIFLNLAVWIPIMILVAIGVTVLGRVVVELDGVRADPLFSLLHEPFKAILGSHWEDYTNGLFVYFVIFTAAWLLLIYSAFGALRHSLKTYFSGRRSGGRGLYKLRRRNEIRSGKLVVRFLALLAFGSIPIASALLQYIATSALSVVNIQVDNELRWLINLSVLLIGIGILVPLIRKTLSQLHLSEKMGVTVPLACALFIYGLFIVSYHVGFATANTLEEIVAANISDTVANVGNISALLFILLAVGLFIAIVSGIFVNTNSISIHRFYRDRLMEAFMPNVDASGVLSGRSASEDSATWGLSNADDCLLSSLRDDPCRKLYPLICCHVLLNDSDNPRIKRRGGESFILSPLFSGSENTSWVDTRAFNDNGMTLPTAMAISGAAVNPSTGAFGRGPTMSRFVGFTMALLNLRLGYWVNRPDPARPKRARRRPNHFHPGLYALTSALGLTRYFGGYDETSSFLQISDGGHFDNSGLYELFRREVRFILFVDGGQDPEYKFENFVNALRRVGEDFSGIKFEAPDSNGTNSLDILVARDPVGFPFGRKASPRAHTVLKFRYGDEPDGEYPARLVYLKLTMTADLPTLVKGYQAQNSSFPYDTTLDQFFDPDQFDAYRETGRSLALSMIDGATDGDATGLQAIMTRLEGLPKTQSTRTKTAGGVA